MRKLWRGIVRTLFWSYERGSWPYDVMVVLILLFVLVTPRRWFRDHARSAVLPGSQILLVRTDREAHTETYRIDARKLPSSSLRAKPDRELERNLYQVLGASAPALKNHVFQILRITPVRGGDGSILYYDVEVKP